MDELVREAMVLNKAFAERFKVRFEWRRRPAWTQGTRRPQAPAAGDDQPAVQRRQVLARGRRWSRSPPRRPAPSVRVAVHDRGSGIPEGFRSRIFGRFAQADSTATRQKGGTGLGLAICKRLIELMHGRIGFDDRHGGGTTLLVRAAATARRPRMDRHARRGRSTASATSRTTRTSSASCACRSSASAR